MPMPSSDKAQKFLWFNVSLVSSFFLPSGKQDCVVSFAVNISISPKLPDRMEKKNRDFKAAGHGEMPHWDKIADSRFD